MTKPILKTAPNSADIIIVGGGMTGLTMALAAHNATRGAEYEVLLIDAGAVDERLQPEFDGRASSIAAASFNMLRALGVDKGLSGKLGPIKDILVTDGERAGAVPSPLSLHFSASEIARGGVQSAMSYMIENRHLRGALLDQIAKMPNIKILAGAKVTDSGSDENGAYVKLESGAKICAKLLVAADGRASKIRRRAGIETTGWSYNQMAIVTTVAHELPHNHVAHELFLPSGPFAILPLADDESCVGFGRHRSNIVWFEKSRTAKAAYALPNDLFASELARRFGSFLGKVAPVSQRWIYPLGLQTAKAYSAPRLALIGDAAHTIHPVAGQGLNMGLRDVAALADVIETALAQGQDIGAPAALSEYERWRKFDNQALLAASDFFTRLFSNDISPVKHARRLGLGAVDKIAPLRKFFMQEASGQTGELPRLLRESEL